ncbi:MAG: DNA-directed RNA polymerase subunit beta [Pseudoclavibacter caeni]
MREHHRPVLFGEGQFERLVGAPDPAVTHRIAHETAHTLLSRARGEADENVLKRLTHYTDEHGLETIAELWATSASDTLPGVLWRVWVLRALVMSRTMEMTALYDLGVRRLPTADPIVTGLGVPAGVLEVQDFTERVLRGVFSGDMHLALMRAAAFCMVVASGCLEHADAVDATHPEVARRLAEQAGRLTDMARVLRRGAALWQRDALE